MSPVPFRQQPSFRALLFAIVLAATWVYDVVFQSGRFIGLARLGLDLILFVVLLQACLFFYAQFTLPVRTLQERLQIWARLLLHMRNAHGPALFVQNGRLVGQRGENSRAGPSLLWIDTASAVVTRGETGLKQALGPGIHFLASLEHIDAPFSLHTQTYLIGPSYDEPIFGKVPEDATDEDRRRHASMQSKRQMVSGLTRDGNEVVPEIRVVFGLDGSPAQAGTPSSRFRFNKEAIERASRSEGVNVDPVSARRSHVAWNQLPGLIAVDLWREYLAKFTLDELFSSQFDAVPEVIQPEEPPPADTFPATPMIVRRNWPTRLLWRFNNSLERRMLKRDLRDNTNVAVCAPSLPRTSRQMPGRQYTALQIIAQMVRARMMQAAVPILDECGRYSKGHVLSEEHKRLRERGLRVLDVKLSGYRFDPAIEEHIVRQWTTAWLANGTRERAHVEQLEVLAAEAGKQRAVLEHAAVLASAVQSNSLPSVPAALKVLLKASHDELLTDERLHGGGNAELESLSDLSKWVESSQ
jgi:hypothetical protein